MPGLSDEFIRRIKDENDINDVVSSYVDLRNHGRYSMGLCPFHNEKTPSFAVYSDTQSFYCFGCGAGGDVITFIRDIENLDYLDAVKFLADRVGLALPQDGFDDGKASLRRQIYDANRKAAKFYNSVLYTEEGKNGLDYFKKRQLAEKTVTHFGLGYAPDRWDLLTRYLRKQGFTDTVLLQADLAKKSRSGSLIDVFRNRVMFPIIDLKGNVVGFGGRVLDDSKPKYLNTSDTYVYKKSDNLFALNFAKNEGSGKLILCEGYMDVISYHQAGFTNAVAGLGTAFTPGQAKLLSRYADEVILSYDADEAGQKATKRTLGILSDSSLSVKVAILTGGKDSDEIIKKYGSEKMREILDSAVSSAGYEIQSASEKIDRSTPEGMAKYISNSCKVIANMASAVSRDLYISKLSSETGVLRQAISSEVDKIRRRKINDGKKKEQRQASSFKIQNDAAVNPDRQRKLAWYKAEENLIGMLVSSPELYKDIKDKADKNMFASDADSRIFSIIKTRLDDGRGVEMSYLSADLSREEMSHLSRLVASRAGLKNTSSEIRECLNTMISEKRKFDIESSGVGDMSDDDFLKLFNRNN